MLDLTFIPMENYVVPKSPWGDMLGPASVLSFVASALWALWELGIYGTLGNYVRSCQRGMGPLERGNSWRFGELCKLQATWYGPSGKGEFLAFWGIM